MKTIPQTLSMNSRPTFSSRILVAAVIGCASLAALNAAAQPATGTAQEIRIVQAELTVEVSTDGGNRWILTQTNQSLRTGDHLRTGPNSSVTLLLSDNSVVRFGALTELEILRPHEPGAESGLRLFRGLLSFLHRDRPGRIRVITRGAVAGIDGTEFVMAVELIDGTERTTLSVIDGIVSFGNEQNTLIVTNKQQAIAEPGKAPMFTAGFIAENILQWCFYYPGILDLRDLPLTAAEQQTLAASLEAYRSGDLLAALAKYPDGRQPASDAERVYYAALLLSVGQVEKTETALSTLAVANSTERLKRLATALRQLIAAVKRQPNPSTLNPELSTEFIAASYFEQSRALGEESLRHALDFARQAATNSPEFGFAWERVAELEFSFGRTARALEALEKSLTLAPRNAQALALKGFLLAAQNKPREAIAWFDRALEVDSTLGNAWLGRGLARIRRGDLRGGREDLLIAAALEPRRASLRSYLGKAYGDSNDPKRALHELDLAKEIDSKDPTPPLYSALIKAEHNRINEAIRDLEKSQELNDNRSVYRSSLLLDQDRAVRSVNLANIYRDAGMADVSLREASRAVSYDYANYSAHLFLAGSYYELRDPKLFNLRYETPANASTCSQTCLRQSGPGLFRRPFRSKSTQDYLSATVSGSCRGRSTSVAAIGFNQVRSMESPITSAIPRRHFIDRKTASGQTTILNSVSSPFWPNSRSIHRIAFFFRCRMRSSAGGDLFQYYDQKQANRSVRFEERQDPNVILGYHHEWSPGVHTLFLATRLHDQFSFTNPAQPTLFARQPLTEVDGLTMHENFEGTLEIYSAEIQQIWQGPAQTAIAGSRFQYGDVDTRNLQNFPSRAGVAFPDPPEPAANQNIDSLFRRFSIYGYYFWRVVAPLQLIGGATYDHMTFPQNFRAAPLSTAEETVERVSPKAGLIWTPARDTTVRFAYTRSLAGAGRDQSFQLEPAQVAGFVQSYRSIIPESVAGANSGAAFETFGLSLEQKFSSGTYIGLSGEILDSTVQRTVGAFLYNPRKFDYAIPSGLREHLDYEERSVTAVLNQLFGNDWTVGARYRLSQAELSDDFVRVPAKTQVSQFTARQNLESVLHQVNLHAVYNHQSGLFSQIQVLWNLQSNHGYAPDQPGDDFWQFNLLAGYRFPRRKAELTIGLLNVTDQDYRLNPLTLYHELPRERTLFARLQLNF
jgi:Flp pilus assembly protein TadD